MKNTVFTEEVDSRIHGLAIAIDFVIIGIFLMVYPNYFGSKGVTSYVRWGFIIIGIIGGISEINNMKKRVGIEGVDDLICGIVLILLCVWLMQYAKLIAFILLVLSLFGFISGALKVGYSLYNNRKIRNIPMKLNSVDYIILITQLLGLVLVILQLIEAIYN